MPGGVILDLSMAIINRTAVYSMGEELAALLAARNARYRYWMHTSRRPIDWNGSPLTSLLGKAIGRFMMRSVAAQGLASLTWRRGARVIIFLDPIFAAVTPVAAEDIVLIHDVGPVSHPEFYDRGTQGAYETAYRRIMAAGSRLVFVSDSTRREFLARYPGTYRDTCVIPPFFFSALAHTVPTPVQVGAAPFVLMVGGLEARKNHTRALAAFAESGLAAQGYRLVIVGPRGNRAPEVLADISRHGFATYAGIPDAAGLRWLYEQAEVLLFPSLLEGFGLPALEAPSLGTLPIVSRDTALAEVVGGQGLLVDPLSVESISQALRTAVGMTRAEREAEVARIRTHQARYSRDAFRDLWQRTISEALLQG
jgi:glycosyltransferase involved in cell wall biosynthesis